MTWRIWFLVFIVCGWSFTGCRKTTASSTDATGSKPPPLEKPAVMPKELVFALTPSMDPALMRRAYGPVIQYISRRIGVPTRLVFASSYSQMQQMLNSGKTDVAQLPAYAYIKARQEHPELRPLVRQLHDGSDSYVGYVISLKSRKFSRLTDLSGTSLGLIDPNSTSGFLMPMLLFHEKGIAPKTFFKSIRFLGNHTNAIKAVLAGKVDVAAVDSLTITTSYSAGFNADKIRIIAKSGRIPFECWCATKRLPRELDERLVRIFLSLNTRSAEGRRVLGNKLKVNGYIRASFRDYRQIMRAHNLATRLGLSKLAKPPVKTPPKMPHQPPTK